MNANIHTIEETARAAQVSRGMLQYHIRRGRIPRPEPWNGRPVFTAEQVEAIIHFFSHRQMWEITK